MDLICPKCQGTMRNYERNGVHVDQCTDCRGIFLDRGELEQIMDAERTWHSGAADPSGERDGLPPQSAGGLGAIVGEVMQQARGHKQGGYGKHDDYSEHNNDGYSRRKRKESFLGDLFG